MPQDHQAEFFNLLKLAPEKRGADFEALYFRQLQQVTNQIHKTDNITQLMLDVSKDICELFNADRLTLYVVNEDCSAIISKVKTGLNTSQDLKLPISAQSIAGYAALTHRMFNIADVYEVETLKKIHPTLRFLQEVDKRSGYRTRQMMVAPIFDGETLYGILQVINNRSNQPFGKLDEDGAGQLCQTLAIALRQRLQKVQVASLQRKPTRYDGLVTDGALKQEALQQCLQQAQEEGQSVEHLLSVNLQIQPAQIGRSLARYFGAVYEPFKAGRLRSDAVHGLLKRNFVEQQGWIPLEEGPAGLVIMCLDPEAVRATRMVPQVFPRQPRLSYHVTTQAEFEETVNQLFSDGADSSSINQMLADMSTPLEADAAEDSALESAAADNELVKFVNKVIIDAYRQRASDIHIEPLPGKAKTGIRFRVDGTLHPYIEVPAHYRQAMITRLKIMCDLDISEKRKPQDGKIKFSKYGPLDIELRVATIPSTGGVEDIVMRILSAGEPIPLDKLGLSAHNKARLEKVIYRPYGLFYVCGPTGSGKTTTLHSILKSLNTPDTKIWTAEDPVEITQKGLRQVQINRKAGIDFALVMRAFLRADPDIIMVGESRDKETVSMGIEASLTGHLVLSTLHTNSAPESITRLLDMGMDPFNFADALLGILAQRLVKKLCDCKQAYQPEPQEVQDFANDYAQELKQTHAWQLDLAGETQKLLNGWMSEVGNGNKLTMYRAVGCEKCGKTGYRGRIGLHELMVADDELKKLIQGRARVDELFACAMASGMRTLKMDGMEKVLMGLTDLKMVRAACIK